MRRHGYLIFASGWLLTAAFTPLVRAEDNSLQNQYLRIYLEINSAENLERQNDFRGALADFKDCYARLLRIHNTDPNWESALVLSRMNDCRTKIGELADQASEQAEAPPTSGGGMASTPEESGANPSGEVPSDVPTLRARLSEVEQQLQDTRAKLQNSQLEVTALHAQLTAVNQQLTALKSQGTEDNQMGKLLSENKELTEKLTTARKEIASIKSPNPRSALSIIRAQLKNTQDQLDASQAANTALQQTTSTLRDQLDQAQSDLTTANQRLAVASPSTPEYDTLKRENEVMRDILTRELQEQAHRDMAKRLMQEEFDRLKITSSVLREQLDILGSPMTPPNSEQERALLDGLKTAGAQVAPVPAGPGSGFSASNAAPSSSPSTNVAGSTPSAATTNVVETPGTNSPTAVPPAAISGEVTSSATSAPGSNTMPSKTATTPSTNVPSASSIVAASTNPAPTTVTDVSIPVTPTTPAVVTPAMPPGTATNLAAATAPTTNAPDVGTNLASATPPATNAPDMSTNTAAATPPTSNAPDTSTNLASATAPSTNAPGSSTSNGGVDFSLCSGGHNE